MTTADRPHRKTLWVTRKAHEAVSSMQKVLSERLGYRVSQSETAIRGMEALKREIEAGK